MSDKEKRLSAEIISIFDRLPDVKKQRLVGVAEGLDMASAASAHDAAGQEKENEGVAAHEPH